MTVGIISYLTPRGLGTMAHDLRQQLGIGHQMVVPDSDWPYVQSWANGEEFYLQQWNVQAEDLQAWKQMDGIDTVIAIETPFGHQTFRWAKELGMRTILIVMWEHFHPRDDAYKGVDLYICPSWRCYQEVPYDNRLFLPWPVDTDEFKFRHRTGTANVFVHNAGSGGLGGRKGTRETIVGFMKAKPQELGIRLILRSQVPLLEIVPDIDELLHGQTTDWLTIEGPKLNRADLYDEGDVLIYPSHYDGHALVTLEGMACGMPVITTDAEPMNEFTKADDKLLVKVQERKFAGTVNPHCLANVVDVDDLAEVIRYCATTDMSDISAHNRRVAEKEHSWNALRDRWRSKLGMK